jgi:hypothetical protein
MSSSSSTSNALAAREAFIRSLKLIFFVVLLPLFLTWCHLCVTLQLHGILLVEKVSGSRGTLESSSLSIPPGIYWSLSPRSTNGGSVYVRPETSPWQKRPFLFDTAAWPSISQVAASLVRRQGTSHEAMKLEYDNNHQSYCFLSMEGTICPVQEEQQSVEDSTRGFFPPALAKWKVAVSTSNKNKVAKTSNNEEETFILRIKSHRWLKPYYFQKEEKPFQQLFQRPATSFLWALNIGLAAVYWNYRVNPNSVALQDGPILQQYQYWRAITGSLAHFEWWHLMVGDR